MTEKSIYESFHLKTVDVPGPEQAERQGRLYSKEHSKKPGGLVVEDMIYGVKMAHMSCTDDSPDRLKKSGSNTIACLEQIVGPGEAARKPLTTLLKEHFDLTMDCWIDESGLRQGRPVDTQGFIASNSSTIVLSYRFSTSLMDWVTNLSMTSSEWEPDVDELIGHAGFCSCLDGVFSKYFTSKGKPRVHTGFYNNFLYTIPMIRKHILEPLLKPDATPKKVYICGCSLGAAIATLAFCFVLQEMQPSLENPSFVNHKLINVTAGSPRVCDALMRKTVMDRVQKLRPLDRAVVCRLVYNKDLVPHIPFHIMAFVHLDKLVYITKEGEVLINPKLTGSKNFTEVKEVFNNFCKKNEVKPVNANDKPDQEKSAFELECEKTPEPIKDHMPIWYLNCLENLKVKVDAGKV